MTPVQFTPGQLREAVGISVETFRHWKRVLPSFANRKGYVPSFTMGDLLTSRILRQLTEGCGVRVGHLIKVSDEIARVCNTTAWASLEHKVFFIDLVKGTCLLARPKDSVSANELVLICPLRPIVRELREVLLRSYPASHQQSLLFPPLEVPEQASRRRAS
jgi:hypothetical protein